MNQGGFFMNENSAKLREWAINKIKRDYPDDIALLVGVPGGSVNNDGHGEPFDYFIPCTERGYELAQTFIINGVGNDLYPRDWDRTLRTANLEDMATLCLGDGVVLYSRTKEDEAKFEAIRQKLYDNLSNPLFVYTKAVENLEQAKNQFKMLIFEEEPHKATMYAGFVQHYLMISVNCINGTYWKAWHEGVIPALKNLKILPKDYVELYEQLLAARDKASRIRICKVLIQNTSELILNFKCLNPGAFSNPDYEYLAEWYQELRTTFNRMYYYCGLSNADAAFTDAVNLQSELLRLADDYPLTQIDLLTDYRSDDLQQLKIKGIAIEKQIKQLLHENKITLQEFADVEEFLASEKR
jgi:hypothetical protein